MGSSWELGLLGKGVTKYQAAAKDDVAGKVKAHKYLTVYRGPVLNISVDIPRPSKFGIEA